MSAKRGKAKKKAKRKDDRYVKLTMAESEEAVRLAVESQNADFDAFPAVQRAQACLGAIAIVEALQVLGWRIVRPLKARK